MYIIQIEVGFNTDLEIHEPLKLSVEYESMISKYDCMKLQLKLVEC